MVNDKLNSIINLIGLSVGLASSILIYCYVKNELSFDHFHESKQRIYRVYTSDESSTNEQDHFKTTTSSLLGPTMVRSLPEAEKAARLTVAPGKIYLNDKTSNEDIQLFDSSFFEIFTFKVLKGSLHRALHTSSNLVLSEDIARKYFGDNDPVGDQLKIKIGNDAEWFTVKAVVENPPSNSSIKYSMIISYENCDKFVPEEVADSWFASFGETYVLLRDQADPSFITGKMVPVIKAALGDRYKEGNYTVHLQPLDDIHFGRGWEMGIVKTSDLRYVYILSGIALLVLILASINFTTISIGKSFSRAKEVGVRKVVGSSRLQIIKQFLGESVLMIFFALIAGLIISYVVLPWFNQLSGVELYLDLNVADISFFLLFGIIVGVLSGSYPAFMISGFQSYKILKGDFGFKFKKYNLRRGLVVIQYVIAIVFISVTLLMMQQLRFIMHKDLGFNRDQLINVTLESDISQGLQHAAESAIEKGEKVRKVFQGFSGVASVGFSTNKFDGKSWIRVGSAEKGKEEEIRILSSTFIDPGFIPTLEIELVDGRNFSSLNAADYQNAVIVNEALVNELEWQDPLSEQLPGRYESHQVIGVVKDFNYESLHKKVRPLYMSMNPDLLFEAMNQLSMESMFETNLYVRIKAGEIQSTLTAIESKTRELFQDEPFHFEFVDDSIQAQYENERNMNKIISSATILAIIISSLGLFGLSYITLNARTKEIGIRKTLGASFSGLLAHLSKDYLIILVLSSTVAIPIAFYFIQKWLEEFEFRIVVKPHHFLFAIGITLIVSMLTISYLTIKSALRRPVDSLRYE